MALDKVSARAVGVFREVEPARERDGIYQLKITLMEVEPSVWRRLEVPGLLTLDRLHRVLAQAMGWTGAHRHEFVIGDRRYGTPDPESSVSKILREHGMTLRDVVSSENMRFVYLYDMGNHWQHEVVVEKILVTHAGWAMPVCLAGERHCPPEDCGGVEGYEEFLEAIRRRHHPLHHAMLEWVGGRFDPDTFNLDEVNRELGWLR